MSEISHVVHLIEVYAAAKGASPHTVARKCSGDGRTYARLEKFGMPTAIGKHHPGATPEERRKLHAATGAVHGSSAVALSENMEIALLEAKRAGRVDYADFYKTMQAAITTVVLSQTMTTEDGSSRSQSETHMQVRQEVKESELLTAVLLYVMRCVAEGDQHALRAMCVGPKEIEALNELSLEDLYRVAPLRAHCLAIRLDRKLFWPMIERLRAQRESKDVQRDLIKADAPQEMMRRCFGLSGREYARLRRMLMASPAIGRPPEPDEDTAHRLWRELSPKLHSSGPGGPRPEAYLAVHRETGAPLRAVWNAAQRWLEHGDVHGPGGSAAARPIR